MAKVFYIDFSGYCKIEAESIEEAEELFWKKLQPPSEDAYDDVYNVDGVEEVEG